MRLGFWLALVLLLVLIFAPPAALLLYRIAVKRWIAPPSEHTDPKEVGIVKSRNAGIDSPELVK